MTDTGIEYHGQLPLAWRDGGLAAARISEAMRENVLTLQALAALESTHTPPAHESERSPSAEQHAPRMEAKLDLLLHWVAALLLERHPLPPVSEVSLGTHSVTWHTPVQFKVGDEGVISLYLAPRLPAPLSLPVRITSYQNGRAQATLQHLSEEAQDWLDRTLFRYHRRSLQARAQS